MKEKEKNKIKLAREKGITLIALVITVIILIILASITIGEVLGEGGLIKKAELAKNMLEESTKEEQEALNKLLDDYQALLEEGKQYQINIQSNLIIYNETLGEFPIIYNITGSQNGKTVYEDMAMVTIGKSGNTDNNITINNISSGTTITIEAIYYGANYDLLSEKIKTINTTEDNTKIQTVKFEYEYNGKIIGNSGI